MPALASSYLDVLWQVAAILSPLETFCSLRARYVQCSVLGICLQSGQPWITSKDLALKSDNFEILLITCVTLGIVK